MPYKRSKPFFQRHQATLINLLTAVVFGLLVLSTIMLTPQAIEHLQDQAVTYLEKESR